jgi:hypothetical protein
MVGITVALLATHWTPTFENCRRSLHLHGYDYDILGWGEKWQGFSWRAKLYSDYCKARTRSSIVVFLDAYDTLAVRSSSDFLEYYDAFKRPVVVGAEWWCSSKKNCGTVINWWKGNELKQAFRSRVNGGCIAGRSEMLGHIYSWIVSKNYEDDQKGLADWIDLYGHDSVALDSGSALFYNGNIFDGLRPARSAFFHHFPGPLLKYGLMPLYNNTVKKVLGYSARAQYPDTIIQTLLFAAFVTFAFFVLSRAMPKKLLKR